MEKQKVENYLIGIAKYIPQEAISELKYHLEQADDSKLFSLQTLQLKDPNIILLISVIAGTLGIDRFLIGENGMGLGKLLTGGGCGVWWFIDLFLIQDATREANLNKIRQVLSF